MVSKANCISIPKNLILQQDKSDDYVIATGVTTTVRDFVKQAFQNIGLKIEFRGEGVEEKGNLTKINETLFTEKVGNQYLKQIRAKVSTPLGGDLEGGAIIEVNPRYFRPTEVDLLIGDPTKAHEKLGWKPEYDLKGLVEDMMQSDIQLMKKDVYLRAGG